MQRSWREDPDKLTFITALPPQNIDSRHFEEIKEGEFDNAETLAGDVNLFLCELAEDKEEDDDNIDDYDKSRNNSEGNSAPRYSGEVELMVAVPSHRGKGMGKAALLSFLRYVLEHADELAEQIHTSRQPQSQSQKGQSSAKPELAKLTVKINKDNITSLGLFDSIGFGRIGGSDAVNYFGEVEFEMAIGADSRMKIDALMAGAGIGNWSEVRYVPMCENS